ncbi:hypothetical protein [Cryobacterium sp. MLB-32]|uniref:hypothetical protein n=1 Tax=Cryobacterium sp. MLB-32 TaxID=1529318 RepID=UPI0012E00311|nr:hypothetical protein [Cryobacterium sp. MLB-32]
MNSETLPLTSDSELSAPRDLHGVISDSRRRQLDLFRQRQSERESDLTSPGTPDGDSTH